MRYLKMIVTFLIFITISGLSYEVIQNSHENQKYKLDYAELNHFKYGLFSVDAWKEQLSTIIVDEIDKLYLTPTNKLTLKKHLEKSLSILIDKVADRIKKSNADSPMKQTIIENFMDLEEIKKGIPDYASAIMSEMSTSKTENQIKTMLKERIDKYMQVTFDTQDKARKEKIIEKIGYGNEEMAKDDLQKIIDRNHGIISEQAMIIVILAIVLFIIEAFTRGPLIPYHYFILTFTLLVMMMVGVTTPMIDMEAKIAHLSFVLFDHPIVFDNQVLYFQSKSILDVFLVMIKHKEIQMKVVGVLVVGFSVIFPVFKMLSSLAYYYNYCKARQYRLIQFFVEKSGKWSMADVMVVAIFMAYIGFNGIINSQLASMSETSPNLELITTNGTSLQPGYYLFLTYTILAMFLSNFLKSRPYQCDEFIPLPSSFNLEHEH